MAASVLAYIQAWDVLRILAHKQVVGQPAPYTTTPLSTSLLVATANEQNGVAIATAKPKDDPAQGNGIHPQQTAVANSRPVTRKTRQPKSAAPSPRISGSPQKGQDRHMRNASSEDALRYGDGTPVAADNLTEHHTYARYLEFNGENPPSKAALLAFYEQRVAAS